MTIINKPDFKVFASEAKSGEVTTFPDLMRGWGITIDQTAGMPPMEWFNALQQRTDEWLMYLSQRGISEWDGTLDYPKNAVVQSGGNFYVTIRENKGQVPEKSQSDWQPMIADATLKNKGIAQLSSATDSDSETMAATPKAVKAAIDLAASTSVKSVNGKKGEVKLTADDVGALAQTGGTVNGALHVGGDFTAKAATFGGNITVSWGGKTAHYLETGDVEGQIWGDGTLSSWLNKQLQNRTQTTGGRGGWWYKDESTGFVFQGGVVSRSDNNNIVTFPVGYQRECFGVQMTLSAWRRSSSNNIFATAIGNSGFTAVMYEQEVEANWWAVGV